MVSLCIEMAMPSLVEIPQAMEAPMFLPDKGD